VKEILIFISPKCILLNMYLKKIFLRSTFSGEFQKNYLDDLKKQLQKQEDKKVELEEMNYQRTLPESVLNE